MAVVLARLLSPDGYGLLYLTVTVLTICTLFARLGFGQSAARYITEYEELDRGQIPHILETVIIALAITLSIVAVTVIFVREQLAVIFGDSEIAPLLTVGVLYIISGGIVGVGRRLCQGFKAIKWAAYVRIVESIVRPVVAISLVLAGVGVVGALIGYIAGSVIGSIIAIGYVGYRYRRSDRSIIKPNLRRQIVEYSLPITLTQNADTVIKRIDVLLIGVFLTPLAVSYYVVAKQIITFLKAPANSLGFAISPRYSEQVQKGNLETASKLYEEALTGTLAFYVPAMVGLIIVAEPTLSLLFGPAYIGGTTVLQILTLYLLAQTVSYITGGGLNFLGKAKIRAYLKASAAIFNLLLNIILIPTIGIIGAAISSAGTYSIYVAANVYLIHRELDLDWWSIGPRLIKVALVTTFMTVVVFPASYLINGPISLIGVVLVGGVIWLLSCLATGLINTRELYSALPNI